MYTIDKFFCASLPDGTIALGCFSVIYSLITAIVCIFRADLSALFWYTFLGVGTGVLLLIAVKKSSKILLLPWLGVNGFQLVILTPLAFVLIIWQHITEFGILFGSLIYLILITLVVGYGWIGVYSYYLSFKNENQNGAPASQRGLV